MTLLSALVLLLVVGTVMYLIHQYVPAPWAGVLLVVCGIALLVAVFQALGLVDILNKPIRA